MSIGHKDPALVMAREIVKQICECGETDGDHTGRRATIYSPPDGPCGATGCTCQKFKRAKLTVTRSTR